MPLIQNHNLLFLIKVLPHEMEPIPVDTVNEPKKLWLDRLWVLGENLPLLVCSMDIAIK